MPTKAKKDEKKCKKSTLSSSVTIHFEDFKYLKIKGRPPCVFQSNIQGKHVTSYHLVEYGLQRILDNFSDEEVSSLKLIDRNSLRERRKKLYNYISAIAILDSQRKGELFEAFDTQLETYNQKRIKKTEIKEKIRAKKIAEMKDDYKANREKLQSVFIMMSRTILTFYNKIQEVSFLPTKKSTSPVTDKDNKDAAKFLSNFNKFNKEDLPKFTRWIVDGDNNVINSPTVTVKCDPIVKAMLNSIDYRKIKIEELEEHQEEISSSNTVKSKLKKISVLRDNEEATLIRMLARHIHIFFAVYHELQKYLLQEITDTDQGKCKTDIIRNFIREFLNTQWGLENPDDLQTKTEDIIVKVKQRLNEYQKLAQEEGYMQHLSEKKDLCSSEDESDKEINTTTNLQQFSLVDPPVQSFSNHTLMQFDLSGKNSNFPTYNDRPRLSDPINRPRCYST